MAEFGIRSKSPLERWCRLYREGGAEALRPDRRAGRGGRGRNPAPAPASRSSRSAAAGSRPRSPT
ncbi:MAG: helix-turn-helix domain-containing protein [Collinsella aerofaciens]